MGNKEFVFGLYEEIEVVPEGKSPPLMDNGTFFVERWR
jgi:hypothetical protein